MQDMDRLLQEKMMLVIQYCQNIQVLLEKDKTHFGDNNLKLLAESNQDKSLVLDKLSVTVSELQNHLQRHHQGESFNTLEKIPAYSEIIKKLKSELNKCYQSLTVNNHIVFANLNQLKDIWDKLLSSKIEANGMYDHTGSINK
jgi:hypothetical protein